MKKLYFIGSGKMAAAIAGGLVKSGCFHPGELGAFDPDANAAKLFSSASGIEVDTTDPAKKIAGAENILVAVKPQVIGAALMPYQALLKDKLIISIAAGISIARLQEITGAARIIRVMPNTPALVGKGASGYAASESVTIEEKALAGQILSSFGIAMELKENDLDAVTALSGSGPAYVFEFIQALADGGVAEGLPRNTALQLAAQTVIGAAEMVLQTGIHPPTLKDQVTSPGGTTSNALDVVPAGLVP